MLCLLLPGFLYEKWLRFLKSPISKDVASIPCFKSYFNKLFTRCDSESILVKPLVGLLGYAATRIFYGADASCEYKELLELYLNHVSLLFLGRRQTQHYMVLAVSINNIYFINSYGWEDSTSSSIILLVSFREKRIFYSSSCKSNDILAIFYT